MTNKLQPGIGVILRQASGKAQECKIARGQEGGLGEDPTARQNGKCAKEKGIKGSRTLNSGLAILTLHNSVHDCLPVLAND